jgi:hypothetical protein
MKTIGLLCLLAFFPHPSFAAPAGVAVVELFTSEGCSSCPPAERVLADLADRPGVYALEFHVDYWNSLGWRDPFSDAAYSARQRAYSEDVYTPQMIVNGTNAFVGSNQSLAEAAITAAVAVPARVTLFLELREGRLAYRASGAPRGARLCVAIVDAHRTTKVLRGENAGRTLAHAQVVRVFVARPLAESGSGSIALPAAWASHDGIIAYVQKPASREILGACAIPAGPNLRLVRRP